MHDSVAQNAIEMRNLRISYRRYTRKAATLKDAVTSMFRGTQYDEFWAVRDLTLDVKVGESVGVVGPNGSGKSTLMKTIAGVLPAPKGSLKVNGLVAPLIELGGGFNTELTGRENIFLNGAIMGRTKREMLSKVDRIIDFAELGEFIDAPLSTYSSGMRARLGFAVATDVDPDILLLDEVFSVGDAAFAAKATERMEGFFGGSKTVITVSHNFDLIKRLCSRALYLKAGQVLADGKPEDVIAQYESDVIQAKAEAKARAKAKAAS